MSHVSATGQGGSQQESQQERHRRLIRATREGGLAVKDDPAYWCICRLGDHLIEFHCLEPMCRANAHKVRVPDETGGSRSAEAFFTGIAGLQRYVTVKHRWQNWDDLDVADVARRAHKTYLSVDQVEAVYSGRHDLYKVQLVVTK